MQGRDVAHLLEDLDAYLCELAGAQIRDGLHILGHAPEGEPLVELLFALTRLPNLDAPSIRVAVATFYGLALDDLLDGLGKRLDSMPCNTRRRRRPAWYADGQAARHQR